MHPTSSQKRSIFNQSTSKCFSEHSNVDAQEAYTQRVVSLSPLYCTKIGLADLLLQVDATVWLLMVSDRGVGQAAVLASSVSPMTCWSYTVSDSAVSPMTFRPCRRVRLFSFTHDKFVTLYIQQSQILQFHPRHIDHPQGQTLQPHPGHIAHEIG